MVAAYQAQEEKCQHSSSLVPYSIYECNIPRSFPNVPMHWHKEVEIDYVLSGKGKFICGEEHFGVREGDVIIIPPNILHAAYPFSQENLQYKAFVFHLNMLGLESNDRSSSSYIRPFLVGEMHLIVKYDMAHTDYLVMRPLVETLLTNAGKNTSHDDLLVKGILLQLFWILTKPENILKSSKKHSGYAALVRPAIEHMTYDYMNIITVQELASKCSICPSHFMNSFKKAVGCSAIEYLTHIRIKTACTALEETTDSIATIANNCGYNNLSNFNRQFKKITGVLPHELRKQ